MADQFQLPETYDPAFHGDIDSSPYLRKLKYTRLGKTNLKVSHIGLGTAVLGNVFEQIDRNEGILATQEAVKYGINYIDTAPAYNTSEDVLGDALKEVPRNTYYIATKVGRYFATDKDGKFDYARTFDFSRSAVIKNFERSLQRLALPYVDVIQIHDVDIANNMEMILKETLPTLESFVKAGKARFIGITGYDLKFMKTVADNFKIDTVLNFSRFNLQDVTLADYLDEFATQDVGIVNAAALAQGLLTTAGPRPWHFASDDLKATTRKAVQLATEMGTTIEDVSLGFSLRPQYKQIATSLVSIPDREKLVQNLDIAIRPYTQADEKLYQEFRNVFGNKNNHWEGRELEEYQKALQEALKN